MSNRKTLLQHPAFYYQNPASCGGNQKVKTQKLKMRNQKQIVPSRNFGNTTYKGGTTTHSPCTIYYNRGTATYSPCTTGCKCGTTTYSPCTISYNGGTTTYSPGTTGYKCGTMTYSPGTIKHKIEFSLKKLNINH